LDCGIACFIAKPWRHFNNIRRRSQDIFGDVLRTLSGSHKMEPFTESGGYYGHLEFRSGKSHREKDGVTDGTRTRNIQNHNLGLYH
jgi:hypothetical protein